MKSAGGRQKRAPKGLSIFENKFQIKAP